MKLLEALVLWLVGLWQARRERTLEVLERKADEAIMWAEDKHFPVFTFKPGTIEQDLLEEFRKLEEEVYSRDPRRRMEREQLRAAKNMFAEAHEKDMTRMASMGLLNDQLMAQRQQQLGQHRILPGLAEQMLGMGPKQQLDQYTRNMMAKGLLGSALSVAHMRTYNMPCPVCGAPADHPCT